jgi:PUA-domain protein
MAEVKNRRFLREKEAAQLLNEFTQKLNITATDLFTTPKPNIEVAETQNAKIYFINGQPAVAQRQDTVFPTLKFNTALQKLAKITVNMGAVPHLCNGADLLAPGIVKTEGSFKTGDYLVIIDERFQKPLAIGTALIDSEAAKGLQRGKVAKNLHYVGDPVWNVIKNQ